MTTANPIKLPGCFHWTEETESRRCLYLDEVPVLEVRRQRDGWIVHVYLCDESSAQADVAVRSVAAGMRWGARWTKQRIPQLSALAARRRVTTALVPVVAEAIAP